VIPVLIGGLKAADLAANPFISDLRLSDLQFAEGLTDAKKISKIMSVLLDRVAAQPARQAFEPLRVHVDDCLERFAPQASVAEALDKHYGADTWLPFTLPRQNLSAKMVRGAAAEAIDGVISDVAMGSQGDVQLGARLFDALYPMRLPAQHACVLLSLCYGQEGHGPILINSRDTWAVSMMLRAATGLPRHDMLRIWQLIELPDGWGDDDLNEVTRYLAAELAEAALGTGGWELLSDNPDPAARLSEQLAALPGQLALARQETRAPIVVCARYTRRWLEIAGRLADRFPSTVFLLLTGDALPDTTSFNVACATLDPTWPDGADRQWQLTYRRKFKQLGGSSA